MLIYRKLCRLNWLRQSIYIMEDLNHDWEKKFGAARTLHVRLLFMSPEDLIHGSYLQNKVFLNMLTQKFLF